MRTNRAAVAALLVAGVGLAGCGTMTRALGGGKSTPDEFRVVTTAPLVIPPEYSLRAPSPGEPRPQELAPESAARAALLGARQAQTRSQGESLLASKAGADRADPLARYVVDDEFGDIAHKEKSWADRVLFWRKDQPQPQVAAAAGATQAAPLDPAAEQARVQALTGGQPIVIRRETRSRVVKLPGL